MGVRRVENTTQRSSSIPFILMIFICFPNCLDSLGMFSNSEMVRDEINAWRNQSLALHFSPVTCHMFFKNFTNFNFSSNLRSNSLACIEKFIFY